VSDHFQMIKIGKMITSSELTYVRTSSLDEVGLVDYGHENTDIPCYAYTVGYS
jgi:hypothetical protein